MKLMLIILQFLSPERPRIIKTKIRFKLILSISLLTLVGHVASAQQFVSIEQTRQALAKEKDPLKRFTLIEGLRLGGVFASGRTVDSLYCIESIQIAQQLQNDSLLAIAYNGLGSFFTFNKGDIAIGLENYFKGIPLAERVRDKRRLSSLYFDIGAAQLLLKNFKEAAKQTRLGFKNLPSKEQPLYSFMYIQYVGNMTDYFLAINQADSAMLFAAKYDSVSQFLPLASAFTYQASFYKGAANALAGNTNLANEYFEKALAMNSMIAGTDAPLSFFNYYITFLLSNARSREALDQAHSLNRIGIHYNNNNIKMRAAEFLRLAFDALKNLDSAYHYAKVEADLNAKIFNETNQNKVQSLAINEQVRVLEEKAKLKNYQTELKQRGLVIGLVVVIVVALFFYRSNRKEKRAKESLQTALSNLKSTQSQLIQSEKMASLGELTAGIAHEIQNPLNFVNNFSEVSSELIKEMVDEVDKGNTEEVKAIAGDVVQNLEKINHHGKRAADIVKGMLQHSRSSSGKKEPTNINALADEYLRLAYHGLRAKDKTFNATMKTDFDETIGNINIIPQDIGRVILNLITNAFYAVNEKATLRQAQGDSYEPTVTVSTKLESSAEGIKGITKIIKIIVKDNGNGIPQKILDKIFQPFFTTKPTGQGTGLGLSLSYDIVKAHGGELKLETNEGEGSTFTIQIPLS